MNSRFFHSRRVLPPIEIELPRQNSLRSVPQSTQTRPTLPNLRNNRTRRPLIHRPLELSEVVSQSGGHSPCRFCHNLVPSNTYNEHLSYCPIKTELQQVGRSQDQRMELEFLQGRSQQSFMVSTSRQGNVNALRNVEPRYVQLQDPIPNNSATNIPPDIIEEIPSLQNVEEPISLPMRPEPQDTPSLHPLPVFSNPSNEIYIPIQDNPSVNNQSVLPSIPERTDSLNTSFDLSTHEDNTQNQPSQPVNEGNRPPRNNFVVRSQEPITNESATRPRAVSIDSILGRIEGINTENVGVERRGILGLLSMLAGLHGVRAAHFGDFLSMLSEERGLDKETLDNLPVVTYTQEGFKNVDEESKRCTICLDYYEDQQEIKFLWCMHRFHKGCVDQWLDKHTNCPFCKKDYSEALRNIE